VVAIQAPFPLRILQIFGQFEARLTGDLDTMSDYDLELYWEHYGKRWIEFGGKKIRAKSTMAALAVGLWLEDQEDETDAEEWVQMCLEKGLFEIEGEA
jgi:hypothetical protein